MHAQHFIDQPSVRQRNIKQIFVSIVLFVITVNLVSCRHRFAHCVFFVLCICTQPRILTLKRFCFDLCWELQLPIYFCWLFYWIIIGQKLDVFLEPKMTLSNCVVCLTNSPKRAHICGIEIWGGKSRKFSVWEAEAGGRIWLFLNCNWQQSFVDYQYYCKLHCINSGLIFQLNLFNYLPRGPSQLADHV